MMININDKFFFSAKYFWTIMWNRRRTFSFAITRINYIFDQINAALVSIRTCFLKKILKKIPNFWTVLCISTLFWSQSWNGSRTWTESLCRSLKLNNENYITASLFFSKSRHMKTIPWMALRLCLWICSVVCEWVAARLCEWSIVLQLTLHSSSIDCEWREQRTGTRFGLLITAVLWHHREWCGGRFKPP